MIMVSLQIKKKQKCILMGLGGFLLSETLSIKEAIVGFWTMHWSYQNGARETSNGVWGSCCGTMSEGGIAWTLIFAWYLFTLATVISGDLGVVVAAGVPSYLDTTCNNPAIPLHSAAWSSRTDMMMMPSVHFNPPYHPPLHRPPTIPPT